jgi:uncharacterized membrane protein
MRDIERPPVPAAGEMAGIGKNRFDAFSDGVIAIILTIMVLDLKVPKEPTLDALVSLWPVYAAYALSYGNVFFVWLNHHDIFASLEKINRRLLLSNGVLLFVVSLVPFATAFASEAHWTAPLPVVAYGMVMVGVSLAFVRLRVIASQSTSDAQVQAHHRLEARISGWFAVTFLVGTACAAFLPQSALLLYAAAPVARALRRSFIRPRD